MELLDSLLKNESTQTPPSRSDVGVFLIAQTLVDPRKR